MKALIFVIIFIAIFVYSDANSVGSFRIRRDLWETLKSGADVVVDGAKTAGKFVVDKTKDGYYAAVELVASNSKDDEEIVGGINDEKTNHIIVVDQDSIKSDTTTTTESPLLVHQPDIAIDDVVPFDAAYVAPLPDPIE